MEEQIKKGKEEIKTCGDARDKVREVLGSLDKVGENMKERDTGSTESQGRGKRKREAMRETENRRVWDCLEKELSNAQP